MSFVPVILVLALMGVVLAALILAANGAARKGRRFLRPKYQIPADPIQAYDDQVWANWWFPAAPLMRNAWPMWRERVRMQARKVRRKREEPTEE